MEALRAEGLTFTYPGRDRAALTDIDLTVEAGSFVTLCGPSGCGKTTLLRQFKSVLAPHGTRTGKILLEGKPLEDWDARAQTGKVGFVLQSPEEQLVTDKVWHELAFGLESLGYENAVIRLRVAEMASYFGLQEWFHRDVSTLSGGQKQLLNLAAVMTMQPSVLLLDEPTSQLDPIAAADFLHTVAKLNRELGVTVLLSEHRLEEALPLSDRVVVLDGGTILADGEPSQVGARLGELRHPMFDAMPAPMRVWAAVDAGAGECPVTVREGRRWLADYSARHPLGPVPAKETAAPVGPPILQMDGVWFRYEKDGTDIVKDFSLTVNEEEFCALVGGNGAGKTTVLNLAAGLSKPDRGKITLAGRPLETIPEGERYGGLLEVLPQDPQALFGAETVGEELRETLAWLDLEDDEGERRLAEVCDLCELDDLLEVHPSDLSGGERQRAALAKLLLARPRLLLLDEPTKGLDAHFKGRLAAILARLRAGGTAVLMVSHDVEFCARYTDRCVLLFDGAAAAQGAPGEFFAGNSFYTTAANRMARGIQPKAVTVEDLVFSCGGAPVETEKEDLPGPQPTAPKETPPPPSVPAKNRKISARTALAAALVLALIPATIWLGMAFLGERRYYVISLLVILEGLVPFAVAFEGRRPQARELVVLAVLCAITVASRAALAWLPFFKPVTALVIIAGVAFGGESGFLVGAVSAFASNFFFQQGPWTPWQMMAWGLIGFLAGLLFHGRAGGKRVWALCLYGGAATLVLYGGLMNTWDVISVQAELTWPMIWAACLRGLPLDLLHAAATVLFLLAAARPMLEKLERVKVKYAL